MCKCYKDNDINPFVKDVVVLFVSLEIETVGYRNQILFATKLNIVLLALL